MTTPGALVWALAVCAWLGFVGVGVICGVMRVRFLAPRLGERKARTAATLVLCVLLLCVMRPFVRVAGLRGTWPLMRIGALWTVLSAAARLFFGRYVEGRSWADVFADYDILSGRPWLLVLVTTFWGPVLAGMSLG